MQTFSSHQQLSGTAEHPVPLTRCRAHLVQRYGPASTTKSRHWKCSWDTKEDKSPSSTWQPCSLPTLRARGTAQHQTCNTTDWVSEVRTCPCYWDLCSPVKGGHWEVPLLNVPVWRFTGRSNGDESSPPAGHGKARQDTNHSQGKAQSPPFGDVTPSRACSETQQQK